MENINDKVRDKRGNTIRQRPRQLAEIWCRGWETQWRRRRRPNRKIIWNRLCAHTLSCEQNKLSHNFSLIWWYKRGSEWSVVPVINTQLLRAYDSLVFVCDFPMPPPPQLYEKLFHYSISVRDVRHPPLNHVIVIIVYRRKSINYAPHASISI